MYFNVLETTLTEMTTMWYTVICDSEVACTCVWAYSRRKMLILTAVEREDKFTWCVLFSEREHECKGIKINSRKHQQM